MGSNPIPSTLMDSNIGSYQVSQLQQINMTLSSDYVNIPLGKVMFNRLVSLPSTSTAYRMMSDRQRLEQQEIVYSHQQRILRLKALSEERKDQKNLAKSRRILDETSIPSVLRAA